MNTRGMGVVLTAGALLVLLMASGAFAEVSPAAPAVGMNAYNPNTVETVSGKIEHVWTAEPLAGLGPYQMISIRIPDNTVTKVAVAPTFFVNQSGIPLRKDDTVTVTGSLLTADGEPVLLASQFREGTLFTLRDASGNPRWLATAAASGPVCGAPLTVSSLGGPQTIRGKIEHVWATEPAAGFGRREMIAVRQADNTVMDVIVAPPDYVRQSGIPLKISDFVTITGSPVVLDGQPMLVANDLHEGGEFIFRRADGTPLWSAGAMNLYNAATEQTVNGTIEHVWVAPPAPGLRADKMIALRRPDNTIVRVALAPSPFLDRTGIPLTIGDPATITGSLVVADGEPVLLARQLREGGTYELCDAEGNELWNTVVAAAPTG